MDFQYLFTVLARRWRVLIALGAVGVILGAMLYATYPETYEARAVLEILPPRSASGIGSWNADPDRYVIGQVAVLDNISLAANVASKVHGLSTQDVVTSRTIEQEPKSDIVSVVVNRTDPKQAMEIANQYAALYIEGLREAASEQTDKATTAFDQQLADIQASLLTIETKAQTTRVAVDQATLQLVQVNGDPARAQSAQQAVNTASSELASAEAERQQKLAEYSAILQNKGQLALTLVSNVSSSTVSKAQLPTAPAANSAKLLAAALAIGLPALGAAMLVLQAAFSQQVVVEGEVEEALGAAIAAEVPSSLYDPSLDDLLDGVPASAVEAIDQLCVRAEANAPDPEVITIVVAGAKRELGGSRVAVAMAARFAAKGATVTLVDGDQAAGRLTRAFGATGFGGIPALLARSATIDEKEAVRGSARRADSTRRSQRVFAPTALGADVTILGLGAKVGQPVFRRADIAEVLEAARRQAHVVIIDAGPVLESAVALQLARYGDAVVITLPRDGQDRGELAVMAGQLSEVASRLLPVTSASVEEIAPLGDAVEVEIEIAEAGEPASAPDRAQRRVRTPSQRA